MQKLKYPLLIASILALTACGSSSSGGKSSTPSSSSVASSSSSVVSSSSEISSTSSSVSSSASSTSVSVDIGDLNLKSEVDFPVGVAVNAGNESKSLLKNDAYGASHRAIVERHFSQITAGNIMKMSYLHPRIDDYTYTDADALVNYALEHDISVHGHVLVWHSDYQVPNFMKASSVDKATLLTMLDDHITNIVAHFTGRIASWDVVNEAFNEDGTYRENDSVFYKKANKDYIEAAFRSARAADGVVDLYYNDFNLAPGGAKLNGVLAMVDDFQTRDVPISGVGFQMHIFQDWPSTNDIKKSFKAVVDRGLKVKVTELDIPYNNPYSSGFVFKPYTNDKAEAQRTRYCQIAKTYVDTVPAAQRGGFTVWGISDDDTWLNQVLFNNAHKEWPLLFNTEFQPKPALLGVADGLSGKNC